MFPEKQCFPISLLTKCRSITTNPFRLLAADEQGCIKLLLKF